ncbi:MAG: homoserine kinase [Candidatus Gastranaerophilales bacterium]|nr:homoserine kinase [Candidatus Gastranaerophilales bacterium]
MKVSVRVPATSANIGPGFDCLGMALPVYNVVTIDETVLPGTGVEINILSEEENVDNLIIDHIPRDENSVIYKAVELLYNSIGQTPSELKINVQTSIPVTRGLGSSAAVIVGALVAANKLLGNPADESALLSIATEIEGHPDNVTPAVVGGLVISSLENDGSIVYRKLDWPEEWTITVCIPDVELATEISRSVIPKEVPIGDAVFNEKRMGMFVHAVHTKDAELMKLALTDRLHQPYREKLVPGLKELSDAFKHEEDILGCVLSGAGSSMLIISKNNAVDRVNFITSEIMENLNVKADIKTMKIEQNGAEIISE